MEYSFHALLFRAFHAQRNYLRPQISAIGLTPGQPKLLTVLHRLGSCTQRELADQCEIDPAAVCRMLDSLEREGLVSSAGSGGRRSGPVSLTEAGEETYRRWKRRCQAMEKVMLDGFRPEEQAQFADYLARAYRNLRGKQES
ncbi:MarR family transcriptional regulator [Pseudoflavonifractor phocaeensis]|uniref:MarR family winged helix-turn-helix transcriptional regulator n=1 Tax=Pseudoflavonifractor phocaeensis TaxID=1870988 RepID=UPI00195950CF|nr:MarR family transcriptional regulator [Pseudoflavonifractor phocaeensis]MBM6937286.1 MarR family transcriptional regulator [Pseudoflavonifractor phocaeensis]